jgi:outer membrane protein insertion porin family
MWSWSFARENYTVENIRFTGNVTFSSGKLLEQMSLYDRNFIEKNVPFLKKDPFLFSEEILRYDMEKLQRFYQQEGFLYIRIAEKIIDINEKKQTLNLEFDIQEGNPLLVENVSYLIMPDSSGGRDLTAILEEAWNELELQKAQRFRDAQAAIDRDLLIRKLNNFGYPYARVNLQLQVNEAEHTVDMIWQIQSGLLCVFGDIQIGGNHKVSENIIRRQITFKPGEMYNRREIEKSQQQIYSLGMFQIVSVKAALSDPKTSRIPIFIQIREAPGFLTKLGVGYGSEEKFRVSMDSRILGFMGGARRLNLLLKRSDLEPYNVYLEFVQPAFISPKSTFILNPFLLRQEDPGFTVDRSGVRTTVNYPFTRHIKGSLSYIFEDVDQDTSGGGAPSDSEEFQSLYNKSSIVLGGSFDNSRPLFTPNSGMFHTITFTFSGLDFGSDFSYNKLLLDLRWYQKLNGAVLAYRLKFGSIRSFDENGFIPAEERFYAGGASSVRGWGYQQLGPKDEQGDPVGGNSLLEGSVEYRFGVAWKFAGVIFFDFGNVWPETLGQRLNDLRYSPGIGLRYTTPIGPVRLDAARPVWDEEDRWQFHFSVGHAF